MTSIAELERETRSMPKGSIGHYRQRIERVLASGCSAAKCHDANSRLMPLMQLSRSQAIPRRQSQRNLHNVLKYVDRTHPFESPLLLAAITPHASGEEPILKEGTDKYNNLIRWLVMLSDDPNTAAAQSVNAAEVAKQASQFAAREELEMVDLQPVKPEPIGINHLNGEPIGKSALAFPVTIKEIPNLDSQDPGFRPMDPFDPEIFNRAFADQ